jgi:beta-phosphoglucomutase-like phosphatase (HAD superfamily)/thiamine kinase-like enzyme
MNIIIPLGGKGERFKNEGYKLPKPLIKIFDKEMIFYVIDNLTINNFDKLYIIYNKILDNYDFSNTLLSKYSFINFIPINIQTKGAAETLYIGIKEIEKMERINERRKNLILDCDTFYNEDVVQYYRDSVNNNIVFYREKENEKPIYSYIEIDNDNKITKIREKEKISNNANTGIYCFENLELLKQYCEYVINNNILFNNEPYISCVISEMINNNIEFYGIQINEENVKSLGTPNEVKEYIDNTKILLFDLDGTLVNTDNVYIEVWSDILEEFKLCCDKNFFNYFIKGKNDISFLKYLKCDITKEEIDIISKKKDELFIKKITNNNSKILFDDVSYFFEKNKNNKIAIVTSCNKSSAEFIIEYFGLKKYIDLIIASEDCEIHKPNPEPYLNAIKYFNCKLENVFIFEDSYSGYCSAKRTNVKNICLLENEESCKEILESDEFKYNSYKELNLKDVIEFYLSKENNKCDNLKKIEKNINTKPIKIIKKNKEDLKTGYICDINSYIIEYINGKKEEIVLKISNLDNELSKTAVKLNMYENETYFYNNLSGLLMNVPKYFGSFKDNNKDAVILENLNKYKGEFNKNLNNNIKILLDVVYKIFEIHSTFYFEKEKCLIDSMKNLKKVNEIIYYKELINCRFDKFLKNTKKILTNREQQLFLNIYMNLDEIYNNASNYPLSFCHGDLKSPNLFYKDNNDIIFLDWQYIHLNKGISDIVFLLVESIDFEIRNVELVLNYYYKLQNEKSKINYEEYMNDFKNALCIFPFFVCIWFNSEDNDKLLDPIFPIKFMKNLLKYYNYYLIN